MTTLELSPEDGTLLLSGIVGSVAYGLAGPDSDIDRLGVYAAPTTAFHGLHPPVGKAASKATTSPDCTLHEAGKFAALLLGGNPTITELLWLPDDLYEVRTPLGCDLISIRSAFLSAKRVRDAYLGYAIQQFKRLESGDGSFSADTRKRTAKHARHLARLLHQGLDLYRYGWLTVRLDNPDWYIRFGERVAAGDLDEARRLLAMAEDAFDATRTPLPDRPDEAAVERWLHAVRAAHYQPAPQAPTADRAAVKATRYTVSCLPEDHDAYTAFAVQVEYRGAGRWAVRHGGRWLRDDGTWSTGYDGPFADREPVTDDDWATYHDAYRAWEERHRFDEATALRLARQAAPHIRVGPHTVADAWDHYRKEQTSGF